MTRWQHTLDLGGAGWQMGSVPPAPLWQSADLERVQQWQPAAVPGNLQADLAALGQLPDPYSNPQPAGGPSVVHEGRQWVEARDWWYRRTLAAPLQHGQRALLVLHGVDYYSAVYANGVLLGHHEGMFSAQVYDVSALVQRDGGRLDLAVRLWGAHALPHRRLTLWQRLADPFLQRVLATDMFPPRTRTLKCQMSFGWDFAPRLTTIGLWDDVEVVLSGPVFVADIWVQTRPTGNDAHLSVYLTLNAQAAGRARAVVQVHDGAGHVAASTIADLDLPAGEHVQALAMTLADAHLWQPWDRGEQHLYRLSVEVEPGDGSPPSRASTRFGVRSVEMAADSGAPEAAPWTFVINGRREFIRGANWVPASVLPGCVRRVDYEALIGLARQANCNMLRVWGGGLREKHSFYDLCDELGMLVWQEFPLACPNLLRYPVDAAFLSLLNQETTAIVRTLRNHPSLVLWCGGNEFGPSRNRAVVEAMTRVVAGNDGTRPFRSASPSAGDAHNWRVWHHRAPIQAYAAEHSPFVSEFGLQSVPQRRALAAAVGEESLWPPGPAWQEHNAELPKLRHYAAAFAAEQGLTLEGFRDATQRAQAMGVQVMVEHMRRRKGASGGVMVWQLNEPWPSICWSLLSYDRQPKLAYEVLRRVYSPLLVSVAYEHERRQAGAAVDAQIWLVNDSMEEYSGATVVLSLNGAEVYRRPVTIPADSSTCADTLRLRLPDQPPPWLLQAGLWQNGRLIAHNEYDLSYHDERAMPLLRRALSLFGRWLLH